MLSTYVATFPRSFNSFRTAMPVWLHEKLRVPSIIRKELKPYKGPILFAEHHMSHAASCFLPSPFEEAAILTVDGVGEWATASYGVGKGTDITMLKEIRFPHSLGLLYSAFTYYLGFKVNSAEYKVMGLAPYGKPVHFDRIMKDMVHLNEDGSFKIDMKYFSYDHGLRMTNGAFDDFFGGPPRKPETWMSEREFDIAASIQKVCEEIVLHMARHLHEETGLTKLCMAGGVALNCVANGRVIRETPMKELWVQPAAGDAGGAVGVAHYVYNTIHKQPRAKGWTHAYLGPQFTDAEIAQYLDGAGAKYTTLSDQELPAHTAKLVSESSVVGWFQGRMEFGPRALGGRSILADPRDPKMRDTLNMKIKFREGFRPVRALGPDGQGRRVVRDRLRQPVHAARGPGARGQADDPLGHPRGQLGPPADRDPRGGAALLRPHPRVREDHRRADRHQHVVQRPGGAHRLHPPRRVPVLHADEHGPPRARPPPARQEGAAAAARGRRLAVALRAGLKWPGSVTPKDSGWASRGVCRVGTSSSPGSNAAPRGDMILADGGRRQPVATRDDETG